MPQGDPFIGGRLRPVGERIQRRDGRFTGWLWRCNDLEARNG
jgi:hypothetical protein